MRTNVGLLLTMVVTSTLSACGGSTDTSNGTGGSNGTSAGTGSFTLMSDPAAIGEAASYSVKVSFIPSSASCTKTSVGPCQVNPCNGARDETLSVPNVGEVTLSGADLTGAPLQPAGGGTYAPEDVDGQAGWTSAGQSVTWMWAHAPGDSTVPGGKVMLATPPPITLSGGSAFLTPPATLSRNQDLTVTWTTASLPAADDEVLVDVVGPVSNGISTALSCTFEASAGQGVVPVAALRQLNAGAGSYDVHSKEYLSQTVAVSNGAPWTFEFNVDAHAIAAEGVATGPVTLE